MWPGRLYRYIGEVLLAAVLCAGLFILVAMLAPMATNLTATGGGFLRRVVFDREGTPRIEHRELTYSHKSRSRTVTWYDLDGNKIGSYPQRRAPYLHTGALVDFNKVLTAGWRGRRRNDASRWRYLPPPGQEVPIWHRLPYRGLLAGYLYPYGRPLGYIGPKGFIEPGETGPRFVDPRYIASPGKLGDVWVDQDRIYLIDLDKMTCRRIWRSPSGPIRALGYLGNLGVVLYGNTLEIVDWTLQTQLVATLPEDLRHEVAWRIAWLQDKQGERRLVIGNVGGQEVIVHHLSPEGETLATWKAQMPATRGLSRTRRAVLTVASSVMSPWVGAGLQQFLRHGFPETYRLVRRWVDWPYQPPFLAISLGFTIVSMLLTWSHLRLRSTPFQMGLGLMTALLFSWPGYLVCRSLFELAARVPCPTCGRPRSTDRLQCPRCRARWPLPRETGLEIILPARGT